MIYTMSSFDLLLETYRFALPVRVGRISPKGHSYQYPPMKGIKAKRNPPYAVFFSVLKTPKASQGM